MDSISLDSLDGEAKAAVRAMSDAMIVARSLEGRANVAHAKIEDEYAPLIDALQQSDASAAPRASLPDIRQ